MTMRVHQIAIAYNTMAKMFAVPLFAVPTQI